jgi:hypothetical protein
MCLTLVAKEPAEELEFIGFIGDIYLVMGVRDSKGEAAEAGAGEPQING